MHPDSEMHLRSLPHGAWAGLVLPWRSRRAPEYTSPTRGFCRIRVRRRQGGIMPTGYVGASVAFVLFFWGGVQGGKPHKWLLHITGGPPTPDQDATALQPGASYTLEMPPGARTWQLGGLPPRLALQYYYDWGNMMGAGAIYGRLPRASNNPPLAWEEMALQLIPPPDRRREQPPNPSFDQGNRTQDDGQGAGPSTTLPRPSPTPTPQPAPPSTRSNSSRHRGPLEGDMNSFMQAATQMDSQAASSSDPPPGDTRRTANRPGRIQTSAAMVRHWLRELAAVLQVHSMGDTIPLLLEQTIQTLGTNMESDADVDDGTVGGPGPCKKRRILNMVYIARVRLQAVCEDDGIDGYSQHAIREDPMTALGDLKRGQIAFREATKKQWGDQVAQGEHEIQQAIAAVEAVATDTINGDLDWLTESWGQMLGFLVQEAEELLDEEALPRLRPPGRCGCT